MKTLDMPFADFVADILTKLHEDNASITVAIEDNDATFKLGEFPLRMRRELRYLKRYYLQTLNKVIGVTYEIGNSFKNLDRVKPEAADKAIARCVEIIKRDLVSGFNYVNKESGTKARLVEFQKTAPNPHVTQESVNLVYQDTSYPSDYQDCRCKFVLPVKNIYNAVACIENHLARLSAIYVAMEIEKPNVSRILNGMFQEDAVPAQ